MIKKSSLLLLFSFFIATNLFAQIQWYQYYFIFPENAFYRTTYQGGNVRPNAEVKIACPTVVPNLLSVVYFGYNPGYQFNTNSPSRIFHYQSTTDQMWASYCELEITGAPGTIEETKYLAPARKSAMVSARDNPVSVYAMSQVNLSTDVSGVLEERELGTDYWQIGYMSYNHHVPAGAQGGYTPKSGYMIVGTQQETEIKVNGTIVQQNLNIGEVYCRYKFVGDLTGDHIETTKPVAFFSVTTMAQIPISSDKNDLLFEQIPPTTQWGRYFVIPMPAYIPGGTASLLSKQHVRVLAIKDGTSLTVGGMSNIVMAVGSQTSYDNLSAGQFVEFELTNPNGAFISSNNPVGVCAYLTGTQNNPDGNGDPSQVWIPPVEQRKSSVLVSAFIPNVAPPPQEQTHLKNHYVVIVTPTATKNQTTINSSNIGSADWIDVANSGYSFRLYPASDVAYDIANPEGVIVYGLGLGPEESYYYVAGSGHDNISAVYTISGTVSGLPDNAGVFVYYTVNGGPQQSVTTIAGGTYTIPDIPYGANVVITASPQAGYTGHVISTPTTDNVTEDITGKDIIYTACLPAKIKIISR